MFDASVAGIALHKEGGLDPKDPSSFNAATRLSAILGRSSILSEIAARRAVRRRGGRRSGPSAGRAGDEALRLTCSRPARTRRPARSGRMNAILRGR